MREERPKVMKAKPNLKIGDVTKILAAKWNKLDYEEKKKFVKESEEDKERYLREMEDWEAKQASAAKAAAKKGKKDESDEEDDEWTFYHILTADIDYCCPQT